MARISRLLLVATLGLTACGDRQDGAIEVLWIGTQSSLVAEGAFLPEGARHLRAATNSGLVALDAQAEVVPALAERWIITDDGLSFIFRLREGTWPDGSELTSQSVRRALQQTFRSLRRTPLGLDLAQVEDIRAMTGRVIELRLSAPVPDLLRLLAQPELALDSGTGNTGPMIAEHVAGEEEEAGPAGVLSLRFMPPEQRGLPEQPEWEERVREITLRTAPASEAIERFREGGAALVLGGRIDDLLFVDTGPLARGTVRIDPAIGLFGLLARTDNGLLADRPLREALAMAIDRQELLAGFNLGGWVRTTRIVSPGLPGDPGYVQERWTGMTIEERRAIAAERVAAFVQDQQQAGGDEQGAAPARLTLALANTPGLQLLFRELAAQWALIGVDLVRAEAEPLADLVLLDRVARYADPLWFLNQFDCSLERGLCDEDADYLLDLARETVDPAERAVLLAETEAELLAANIFIPFGMPLRWSLVRGNAAGFAANAFGFHPLPPLAQR